MNTRRSNARKEENDVVSEDQDAEVEMQITGKERATPSASGSRKKLRVTGEFDEFYDIESGEKSPSSKRKLTFDHPAFMKDDDKNEWKVQLESPLKEINRMESPRGKARIKLDHPAFMYNGVKDKCRQIKQDSRFKLRNKRKSEKFKRIINLIKARNNDSVQENMENILSNEVEGKSEASTNEKSSSNEEFIDRNPNESEIMEEDLDVTTNAEDMEKFTSIEYEAQMESDYVNDSKNNEEAFSADAYIINENGDIACRICEQRVDNDLKLYIRQLKHDRSEKASIMDSCLPLLNEGAVDMPQKNTRVNNELNSFR